MSNTQTNLRDELHRRRMASHRLEPLGSGCRDPWLALVGKPIRPAPDWSLGAIWVSTPFGKPRLVSLREVAA
jgi:hypothetical protein